MNAYVKPRILLLDDAPVNSNSLGTLVSSYYEVYYAKDFQEYKQVLSVYEPDCVFIDTETQDIEVSEICSWTRMQPEYVALPIILMLPIHYPIDQHMVLTLEGVDVIAKPVPPDLLRLKVTFHLGVKAQRSLISNKDSALVKASKTIQTLERELALKTVTDDLTGLINRRALMERAQREFKLSQRLSREVSVLMMDLDRFKNINDTYGADFGDQVIVTLGSTCRSMLRETDLVGRMGGDEFAVVLPGTSLEHGVYVAEKIRYQMNYIKNSVGFSDEDKLSLSIGVSAIGPSMDSVEDLFRRANYAMQQAKRSGRDCVIAY